MHSRHVLHGGDWSWYKLLEVMHFVDVLRLPPHTVSLIDEDKILVLIKLHFCDVIEVHLMPQSHEGGDVHRVRWSNETSLSAILNVHVVVIITISDALSVPAGTILELTRDIEPVPVVSHPIQRWSTVSLINFEHVESWTHTKNNESGAFPELNPFSNSSIFVDDIAHSHVEGGVRLHWWSLNERLELIAYVSWCSL